MNDFGNARSSNVYVYIVNTCTSHYYFYYSIREPFLSSTSMAVSSKLSQGNAFYLDYNPFYINSLSAEDAAFVYQIFEMLLLTIISDVRGYNMDQLWVVGVVQIFNP